MPVDARQIPTLAPMLARVTPGVVNISVVEQRRSPVKPFLRDAFLRRLFGLSEPASDPAAGSESAVGSGVIIDAGRGLVVTNNHVIDNAHEIVVILKDHRQLKATLVGADPATDIALLRVAPERLTAVRIGDSDALSVGDFVVAIGNPFGIGQTVTSGIVSALGRTGLGIEGYEDFIQTDASINPGNSGGALVGLQGELIGINTAIIGPTEGNVGIGFAIPAAMMKAVVEQLLRFGEVRRGRVGLAGSDITPDMARDQSLPVSEGALITRVEKDSPAERAGLQVQDVIVAMNARPIRSSSDLRNRVGLVPVGEAVDLRVRRDARTFNIVLRVAEAGAAVVLEGEPVRELLGARVANLEPGMPGHGYAEGAALVSVERGSEAWRAGLRTGDLVLTVNRRRVRDVQGLLLALKGGGRPWRLGLLRGESRISLVLP
jgi:serine protease Do/serine protease DegQ